MKRVLSAVLALVCASGTLFAQSAKPAIAPAARPAVFIPATGDGFDQFIAAAFMKKNVPATIVTRPRDASLTLKAAQVQVKKESGGMKFMKCVVQACANTDDKASTAVQLINKDGAVVWSYAIGDDDSSRKSMAEDIAKHIKKDYFHQ